MFDFIRNRGKNKELEAIMQDINSNLANNYKDAAQEAFALLLRRVDELYADGTLKDKQTEYYKGEITNYRKVLQGFTHKDQKPYWHS